VATKKITDLILRSDFDGTCNVPVDDTTHSWRVTGSEIRDYILNEAVRNALAPAGAVITYAGSSAPSGWLICDGSAVSRSTYSDLFSAIGTTYGIGDGSSTFNVPDCRGVFVRGAGTQTISAISYSGTLGAKQGDTLQGHKHSLTDPTHTHSAAGEPSARQTGANTGWGIAAGATAGTAGVQAASTGVTVQSPTTDTVNGTPRTGSETRPANISLNYIIKT
jgi:microcystin-dependent protein